MAAGGPDATAMDAARAEEQLNILVLGGTQFMGRIMTKELLRLGHRVTMSNRGKSPNPFAGNSNVRLLCCDRMGDRERFAKMISAASDEQDFDAVIDFTGFHRDIIRDTVRALHSVSEQDVRRKVGHYIYISTDSVYMGSLRPFPSLKVGSGMRAGKQLPAQADSSGSFLPPTVERLVETDCLPPTEPEQRSLLKRWNSYQYGYGGNKLGCEQELHAWWEKSKFPYTALRLPDVMGPYDNLGCHLRVQQRIAKGLPLPADGKPDHIDDIRTHRISLIYAPDVVAAVLACLRTGEAVHGHALHIAQQEAPTILEYLPACSESSLRAVSTRSSASAAIVRSGLGQDWHCMIIVTA